MAESRRLKLLMDLDPEERRRKLAAMPDDERTLFEWHWPLWAREEQMPPAGEWRTWLIMAGRGFGKTRAGSEWIRACADADPGARIALVAASLGEARAVMVEGEAGLLSVCPPRLRPVYEPSLRRLTWPQWRAGDTLFSRRAGVLARPPAQPRLQRRRKRSFSITRLWRASTPCCTPRFRTRPTPRPRHPKMARPGSSAQNRAAPGPDMLVLSPLIRMAAGSSPIRAPACGC